MSRRYWFSDAHSQSALAKWPSCDMAQFIAYSFNMSPNHFRMNDLKDCRVFMASRILSNEDIR